MSYLITDRDDLQRRLWELFETGRTVTISKIPTGNLRIATAVLDFQVSEDLVKTIIGGARR